MASGDGQGSLHNGPPTSIAHALGGLSSSTTGIEVGELPLSQPLPRGIDWVSPTIPSGSVSHARSLGSIRFFRHDVLFRSACHTVQSMQHCTPSDR